MFVRSLLSSARTGVCGVRAATLLPKAKATPHAYVAGSTHVRALLTRHRRSLQAPSKSHLHPVPLRRAFSDFVDPAKLKTVAADRLKAARAKLGASRITYIVHFGNLLAVSAMMSDDMLPLRCFMVGASVCGIVYNLLQASPLVAPALWGVFFITGHSIQIYRILMDKVEVQMTGAESDLYEDAFLKHGFTPRQFLELIQKSDATWYCVAEGDNITVQGEPIDTLMYVLYGKHSIIRNERVVNSFDHTSCSDEGGCRGGWMGEVWNPDYDHTEDHRWIVSARADTEVEVVEFDIKKFHSIIRDSHAMQHAGDKMQIDDVWGKLAGAGKLHARKQRESKAHIETLTLQLKDQNLRQYKAMVAMAAADGEISTEEASVCKDFRERNGISDVEHTEAVKACDYNGSFD